MYVFSMDRLLDMLSLMSQVKPGPNMESAVAMKLSRRDSSEEKSSSILFKNCLEQTFEGS